MFGIPPFAELAFARLEEFYMLFYPMVAWMSAVQALIAERHIATP